MAVLFFISFFTTAILLSNHNHAKDDKMNREYFHNFNDTFSGQIFDVKESWSTHRCMLFVKLDSSTTKNYDIRSTTKNYYCVIKGDTAEVLEDIKYGHEGEPENWIRTGDRIKFDGKKDSTFLYHNGKLIMSWKPRISTFSLDQTRLYHRIKQ